MDELILIVGDEWLLGSLRCLSKLIPLSKVTKLTFILGKSFGLSQQALIYIRKLFQLMPDIQSLNLSLSMAYNININDHYFRSIIPLLPKNIKHLTADISTINQMKYLVNQIKSCLSMTFHYVCDYSEHSDIHMQWLKCQHDYYTYKLNTSSLSLWLNNKHKNRFDQVFFLS